MLTPNLKMLHLQLTSRCNLNCTFCGQWGENGFMKSTPPIADLDIKEWLKAIDSIARHCGNSLPEITIWGGEPLLYDSFGKLVEYINKLGFKQKIVTNGTLLEPHMQTINNYIDSLYISIDGPPAIHDKIRGRKGLFEKIKQNISAVDSHVHKVAMSFFTESNYKTLPDLPFELVDMNIDTLLIQNLIFANSKDIAVYKTWLWESYGKRTPHIEAWKLDNMGHYIDELPKIMQQIQTNIEAEKYPIDVRVGPSEMTPDNVKDWYIAENGLDHAERSHDHCLMPFTHLHIKPDGDVHFCVDFDDFSAGNILKNDVIDIFHNEISNRFRQDISQNKNPLCKRCPWRFKKANEDRSST